MVNTIKFSEFADANLNTASNMSVGFTSGANYKTPQTSRWTTAQRPATPYDGLDGYNTDLGQWEYWSNGLNAWVQFTTGSVGVTQINTGTGLTGGPITSTGTLSFAAIAANSLWANITGSPAVPTVIPTTTFLKSANNLSDLTSAASARSNLGLVIGTNVEAWNHTLDLIAAGTWPGATSITTLGTVTTGLWHGSAVDVPYGGTGNTSFTAYSVICAGTTSTSAFQNVATVGTAGQVLTSNGAAALPTWQNTGGSGTVNSGTVNQLAYYASSGSAVSGLSTGNSGVLVTSNLGVPSISSTLPSAVQGNITSVGTVTSGTWNASIVGMTYGGTGAALTPTNNELVYSTGSTLALLATAINGVLVTSGAGAPSISSTLPTAVQGNITQVGTIASGTWNGSGITVPFGGTGLSSMTAYAVLCGGTTSTNALQQVSGVGSIGQVLTSTGAASLPTWQNAVGTGTVNSAAINDLAYYAAAGNTVSGLTTAANGVLVTSAGAVPSISSTLPAAVQANITQVGTISSGSWNGTPVTVPFGGSGLTSTTAYAVVCGGTTTTSALQQVSGLGAVGQVLTSNGAAALPTWQNVTGTGTVNSAAINDLAYYAAAGNTISGIATAANATLVTSAGGVPSISATLPSQVQTNITSLGTITAGTWNGSTIDVSHGGSGNTTFTAYSVLCAGSTSTGAFQNVTGVGSSGQVLTSNGAGTLPTWQPSAGSGTVNASTANYIAYYATTGSAVSGVATATGGVLVTDNTGVPSLLAGSGTTGTVLRAVSGAAPAWSTCTYPGLTSANNLLYSSATNTVGELSTVNSAFLTTTSGGIPTWNTNLAFVRTNLVKFTASGTYTPTTGMKYVWMRAVGNGGGGGGTNSTAGNTCCGGGGGSGGYSELVATAATIGANQTVTVGATGTGGISGTNNGVDGGDVSVGALLIAKGGTHGNGGTSGTGGGAGGAGGVAGTGDVTIPGNAGSSGLNSTVTTTSLFTGRGAGSHFGGAPLGASTTTTLTGAAGGNYGAGGNGGMQWNNGGAAAGGNGSTGIVLILEFIYQ